MTDIPGYPPETIEKIMTENEVGAKAAYCAYMMSHTPAALQEAAQAKCDEAGMSPPPPAETQAAPAPAPDAAPTPAA